MKLLSFQKPNKFHFFFLAYFIAIFGRLILHNNQILIGTNIKAYFFFQIYLNLLSHILSFIPYSISIYLSKRKEKAEKDKLITKYIYNEIPKKYKCKYITKSILILSLLGFFAEASIYLFYILIDQSFGRLFNLGIYSIINAVLIYIFSYLILKTYFYKHHYLSFSINSICFELSLIIDILSLINTKEINYKFYIYIIIRIIRLIFLCVLYCYSKKKFEDSLLNPYSIIAFRSIFEVLFLGLFSIPFTFIPIKDYGKNVGENLFVKLGYYFSDIRILFTIILFIDYYLIHLFLMMIIDKFSPSHLVLAFSLEKLAEDIYSIIKENSFGLIIYWTRYVNLGINLIVFIGTMIHNEIFIINKCGLNEKTQLYLNNEFKKENINNEKIISDSDEITNEEDKESIEMGFIKRNDK